MSKKDRDRLTKNLEEAKAKQFQFTTPKIPNEGDLQYDLRKLAIYWKRTAKEKNIPMDELVEKICWSMIAMLVGCTHKRYEVVELTSAFDMVDDREADDVRTLQELSIYNF